jgi:LysR family transcriptional regulator, glycine cleavage system transcriptional activator
MKKPTQHFARLPLNALRVFEAVASQGSMTRAAALLNVQPSAVSMQIKNLTTYVGQALFAIQGKHWVLTPTGLQLLPVVRRTLADLEASLDALRVNVKQRPFTLALLPSFLHGWLMPRLPKFERQFPDFHLQLLSGRELVDLAQGGADAAIRLGRGKWPGLVSEKLMAEQIFPAATPKLAKQIGRLEVGELPQRSKLLHSSVDPWSIWTNLPNASDVKQVEFDDALALISAAEAGQGVALVRARLSEAQIASGRLVQFGPAMPYRFDYYFVQTKLPEQTTRSAQAQRLLSWLEAETRLDSITIHAR